MTHLENKIDKLIVSINRLIDQLAKCRRDLTIHRCIDLYYYIQKSEELKLLKVILVNVRLDKEVIAERYAEVYCHWRRDALWLNRRVLFNIPCPKIL